MAFDFPNAPSLGQTVTLGNNTYQWNGEAWNMQSGNVGPQGPVGPAGPTGPQGPQGVPGAVPEAPTDGQLYSRRGSDASWQAFVPAPQVGLVYVSDNPPGSPLDRQMWFESDSGRLYLRINDGNSTQWVQVNAAGMPTPPNDGNEYVMRNGVWRLKAQTLDFTNVAQVDVAVPTGAKLVKWAGNVIQASATSNYMQARVSADGSTFLSGATEYSYAGFNHNTGTGAFVNAPAGTQSSLLMTLGQNDATVGHTFDGFLALTRPGGSTVGFFGRGINFSYNTAASNLFQQNVNHLWVNGSAAALIGVTALKALRFMSGAGVAWAAGSIDLEWVY